MSSCSLGRGAMANPGLQSPGARTRGSQYWRENGNDCSLPGISVLPAGPQAGWWFTKSVTTTETGSFRHAGSYSF